MVQAMHIASSGLHGTFLKIILIQKKKKNKRIIPVIFMKYCFILYLVCRLENKFGHSVHIVIIFCSDIIDIFYFSLFFFFCFVLYLDLLFING